MGIALDDNNMKVMGLLLLAYILLAIIVILIKTLISRFFYGVAKEKGFPQKRYFWVPFFFGIIGYILVAALPDRRDVYR